MLAEAEVCISALKRGNKILVCGNGGSAAQAQHFVAELVVRYKKNRKALAAIALTADTAVLTACANDFGYEQVFSRQIEALGNPDDVLIAISTSGNSLNINNALKKAIELKMVRLWPPNYPDKSTAERQEDHLNWLHGLAREIEDAFCE